MGARVVQAIHRRRIEAHDGRTYKKDHGRGDAQDVAMRISLGPIFLPRYSGVRPTISPAMNTVRMTERHAVQAAADTAADDLAQSHEDDGHHAADGRVAVMAWS